MVAVTQQTVKTHHFSPVIRFVAFDQQSCCEKTTNRLAY